jgi:uracil-DNA glycosylase
MNSSELLIIGHSPSPSSKVREGNPTLKRLDRWLDACDVGIYSFTNLQPSISLSIKNLEINKTLFHKMVKNYRKVITLGKEVKHYTNKMGYNFYELPHPSPLNRNLNDKKYEKSVIKGLQIYLNMV